MGMLTDRYGGGRMFTILLASAAIPAVLFGYTTVPWLRSLFTLDPKIDTMAAMVWVAKAQAVGAFALLLLFPYTRLVHVVS